MLTSPRLLLGFLFLRCLAKAVRAQTKHSAVLSTPSMTSLVSENQDPERQVSGAPVGP